MRTRLYMERMKALYAAATKDGTIAGGGEGDPLGAMTLERYIDECEAGTLPRPAAADGSPPTAEPAFATDGTKRGYAQNSYSKDSQMNDTVVWITELTDWKVLDVEDMARHVNLPLQTIREKLADGILDPIHHRKLRGYIRNIVEMAKRMCSIQAEQYREAAKKREETKRKNREARGDPTTVPPPGATVYYAHPAPHGPPGAVTYVQGPPPIPQPVPPHPPSKRSRLGGPPRRAPAFTPPRARAVMEPVPGVVVPPVHVDASPPPPTAPVPTTAAPVPGVSNTVESDALNRPRYTVDPAILRWREPTCAPATSNSTLVAATEKPAGGGGSAQRLWACPITKMGYAGVECDARIPRSAFSEHIASHVATVMKTINELEARVDALEGKRVEV
jgi:hypothetical protein